MSRVLPILFNTEMVRAILDGSKTVIRQICKDGNDYVEPDMSFYDADKRTYAVHNYADLEHEEKLSLVERTCPICPGDILYVRETWNWYNGINGEKKYIYRADYGEEHKHGYWKPSIHMPKEAARIWLKVTEVRVERLQEMKLDDFLSEGVVIRPEAFNDPENAYQQAKGAFVELIKRIYPECTEESWLWVIEFERCEKPEEWCL